MKLLLYLPISFEEEEKITGVWREQDSSIVAANE